MEIPRYELPKNWSTGYVEASYPLRPENIRELILPIESNGIWQE